MNRTPVSRLQITGLLATICIAFPPGCDGLGETETSQIIENLVQAGFPADDIMVHEGKVYVGRDAEVSLAASQEMLTSDDPSKEQYRTTNLVGSSISKICINGSTYTGNYSTALDLAIQNYNALPLRFTMARTPSSGCSFTINASIQTGAAGGVAGFPSGGLPYSSITIFSGLAAYSVDVIEHVITHELGHTIGFRHSDYYNRAISCGAGGNEGDAGVGAILIPGTPSTATVGGSIMNSCFRSTETGEFTSTDVTALNTLYAAPNLVPFMTSATLPSGLVERSGVYSSTYEAWRAFDSSNSTMWISGVFQTPAWISYQWSNGPKTVTSYAINFVNGSLTSRAPRDWTFQGWNGSAWVTVDTRSAQTGWLGVERRVYTVASPGSYIKYRLHVTDDNDSRAGVVVISMGRLELIGF
ncbi:MAG: zinc-dependent metalloprotease [Kofleriaceae bacterium]